MHIVAITLPQGKNMIHNLEQMSRVARMSQLRTFSAPLIASTCEGQETKPENTKQEY